MRKIDIYNHIWPPSFYERLQKLAGNLTDMNRRVAEVPMIMDLDVRFRIMDQFGSYSQILSLASPPLEVLAGPQHAAELARVANDGMAELVAKYPDRFPGFTASLTLADPEAMLAETERAMEQLGAVGTQIFTNAGGRPLDLPEFRPFFRKMAEYDRPIWVHPTRGATFADYASEQRSRYEIWWTFGWPYETSAFMARLVFSKLFDELPNLKIITHHGGGMVPFFEGRLGPGMDQLGSRTSGEDYRKLLTELKERPVEYFRRFYADTATFGSASSIRCALEFFGEDQVVFASDAPFDPEKGPMYIRETIRVLDELDIPEQTRRKLYHGNAVRLLGLPEVA
jgi:aminocarboxymuconate-semialdehyde decarboxylase